MIFNRIIGILAIIAMLVSVLMQIDPNYIKHPIPLLLTLIAYSMVSFTIGYFWRGK